MISDVSQSPEEPRPGRSEADSPLEYLVMMMAYCRAQADALMQQISDISQLQHKVSDTYSSVYVVELRNQHHLLNDSVILPFHPRPPRECKLTLTS